MLFKTRGVVFRFTRYGDTSIITTIFTEQFGLRSYIVNGARSKNARSKMALFQPLTLLDLVVYHKENANINRIKEVHCFHPYQLLPRDFTRSTIALFISEVMNKTVKEESHTQPLCQFLITSLMTLDTMEENVENFHLVFLVKLSRFLGFGAGSTAEVLGIRVASHEIEQSIDQLLVSDYTRKIRLSNSQRREILNLLIQFYNDHTGFSGELKSLQVLRELQS